VSGYAENNRYENVYHAFFPGSILKQCSIRVYLAEDRIGQGITAFHPRRYCGGSEMKKPFPLY